MSNANGNPTESLCPRNREDCPKCSGTGEGEFCERCHSPKGECEDWCEEERIEAARDKAAEDKMDERRLEGRRGWEVRYED